MAFGIKFFQLLAASLRQYRMTGVAVARTDRSGVRAFVIAIVAAKATGPFFVTDIVGMSAPISLHFGKKVTLENRLRGFNNRVDFRMVGIALFQGIANLLERFGFCPVRTR